MLRSISPADQDVIRPTSAQRPTRRRPSEQLSAIGTSTLRPPALTVFARPSRGTSTPNRRLCEDVPRGPMCQIRSTRSEASASAWALRPQSLHVGGKARACRFSPRRKAIARHGRRRAEAHQSRETTGRPDRLRPVTTSVFSFSDSRDQAAASALSRPPYGQITNQPSHHHLFQLCSA